MSRIIIPEPTPRSGTTGLMMSARARGKTARSYEGGRGSRRAAGATTLSGRCRSAPPWTDVAARGALDALACYCEEQGHERQAKFGLFRLLTSPTLEADLCRLLSDVLPPSARALVHDVFAAHAATLATMGHVYKGTVVSFISARMQTMQRHRLPPGAALLPFGPLQLPAAARIPATFLGWLDDANASAEHRIPTPRVHDGLIKLRLTADDIEGVVVYERAWGRVLNERGGDPARVDPRFRASLVQRAVLLTALPHTNDHYYLVGRQRYMTPLEVMRAFGIRPDGPLGSALLDRALPLSPEQAVALLGEAVQSTVVHALLAAHIGPPPAALTYGSAYSGIDTIAEAVDTWSGGGMHYVHASECKASAYRVLARAWGARGLTTANIHEDARLVGSGAPTVDIYAITPLCKPFSTRNHESDPQQLAHSQARALYDTHRALEYVRLRRPRVVIVENVKATTVVAPLTDMLLRITGYTWHGGVVDPWEALRIPMDRTRHFWLGVRTS